MRKHPQWIHQVDDFKLEIFRAVNDGGLRESSEIIIDSDKVVRRFLRAGGVISHLLATEVGYDRLIKSFGCQTLAVENLYLADKKVMESIVGYRLHHGMVARAGRPPDIGFDELGERILILNGVCGSENVGAIVRNAHAFGFNSIIADSRTCSPYVRRAVRCSMGSIFKLGVLHTSNVLQTLDELRQANYAIVGSGLCERSAEFRNSPQFARLALIIGSEGYGMSDEVKGLCHHLYKIPIAADVDSLNAAVAAGIFCHHFSVL